MRHPVRWIKERLRRDYSKSWLQERKERGAAWPSNAERLFGFSLEHLRNAAGFAGAAMLGGGISASTSDHSHHTVTYLFWYGCAGLFVVAAVVLTRMIERRRVRREATDGGVEPGTRPPIHVHIHDPGPHEVREEGGRTIVRPLTNEEARPPGNASGG
jgi:hypothetical protein